MSKKIKAMRADDQFPRDNEMRKRLWLQKKTAYNINKSTAFPLIVFGWRNAQ